MPSRSGSLIKQKFEILLRRDLKREEILKCEELALNMHTGPVLTYLERLAKKPMKHDFDVVLSAATNSIKGAKRSETRKHEMSGRLAAVYKKLDAFRPQMTDGEMLAVIALADRYTDAQIDGAIASARARGVQHVRYVLAVCVGNKNKAAPREKTKIKTAARPVVVGTVSNNWMLDAADQALINALDHMGNDD